MINQHRSIQTTTIVTLVFLVQTLSSHSIANATDRPNVVWITSEDHGPEMGCYGDSVARTPNVDALAAKGMIYKKAWSCAPVCAPARTALITGMYPSSTGGLHMRSMVALPNEAKMFPELLREAGYYCSNNNKEDYNVEKSGKVWDESSKKAHWRNRKPDQPFFSVFNSTKSHESQIRTRPHKAITDPATVRVPAYHPDLPEVRQDWAQYYDKVSEADADAGDVMKQLEQDGLAEDTIVFYFGDHGSGMPRSKRWPCNSGLHVPLVVYFPTKWKYLAPAEYKPGGRSERLVSFVDLGPTVLSIAGITPPSIMQGKPIAGKYETPSDRMLFGQRGRMDERTDLVRSVTDGRYVYIRNYMPHLSQAQHIDYQFQTPTTRLWYEAFQARKTNAAQSRFWKTPKPMEELYDLSNDRDEVIDIARDAEYSDVLFRLRLLNREQIFKVRDIGFLPEGEMHERARGSSPWEVAQVESKYPLERILAAAELASDYPQIDFEELTEMLHDSDSAVRYWAAIGFMIHIQQDSLTARSLLTESLNDSSPYVQIVAAKTLIESGTPDQSDTALKTLKSIIDSYSEDLFVIMSALEAIESLGDKAKSLHPLVQNKNFVFDKAHKRYSDYVPRLLKNIEDAPK